MIYPDLDFRAPDQLQRVHFVGIGGAGMHGVARMMHERGLRVTGSDKQVNANTQALKEAGITVYEGHKAEYVQNADALVITTALRQDNPEYQYALQHNLPILHRAHALEWLTRNKQLIAVAGAHGKTTSTAMLVSALHELQADPSFVNGGVLQAFGVSARTGEGDVFVIEADESDKSFLLYDKEIALITNIDPEHLDFYGSRAAFMQAFADFASTAAKQVIMSADDPGCAEVIAKLGKDKRPLTFGYAQNADVRLCEVDTAGPVSFAVAYRGESVRVNLRVFGEYNAVNAAGVIAVLLQLGYSLQSAARALTTFSGVKSRFEFHAQIAGASIYNDYAHHPTEVAALLESAKNVAAAGRLIAIHQPHLYSRTGHFYKEFATVLEAGADHTLVLAVDGAREEPVPGVTGQIVADEFKDKSKVRYIADWQQAAEYVAEFAQPGDLFVTMSGGNVWRIIPQLVLELVRKHGETSAVYAPDFDQSVLKQLRAQAAGK